MPFNKSILMGNLTASPELKQTPNGIAVCSFTIAVKRKYGEETDFINCVAWRQTAEFISKYFHKGNLILAAGSIQVRSWNDKDGNKRYATEVVVDEVSFASSKKSSGDTSDGGNDTSARPSDGEFVEMATDDDLPF